MTSKSTTYFRLILSYLWLILLPFCTLLESVEQNQDTLARETELLKERSKDLIQFYDLKNGEDIREITADLLNSPLIIESRKPAIRANERRIFVFTYPSDGLMIKGLISYIPNPQKQRTMILTRGGNNFIALLDPASRLMNLETYTVISSALRGAVSEGRDEFGGEDVNDIKNLIDYIPILEEKLQIHLQKEKMIMLGPSRGAMQMFLFLSRYPEMQSQFAKIVSLSGILDIRQYIRERPDMKTMFIQDFGLIEKGNLDEWADRRDPLLTADKIRRDLPILILQGSADNRVSLEHGYNMVSTLQSNENEVTYWEIDGGNHCLSNMDDLTSRIYSWVENGK